MRNSRSMVVSSISSPHVLRIVTNDFWLSDGSTAPFALNCAVNESLLYLAPKGHFCSDLCHICAEMRLVLLVNFNIRRSERKGKFYRYVFRSDSTHLLASLILGYSTVEGSSRHPNSARHSLHSIDLVDERTRTGR